MKIELNKENYLTGNYATVGGGKSWTEVDNLPIFTDDEDFSNKIICYQYIDNQFVFDEEKYNKLKEEKIKIMKKSELTAQIISLKEELSETDYQVIKCAECTALNYEMPYDIEALHKNRQAIRDKINELETKITEIEVKE